MGHSQVVVTVRALRALVIRKQLGPGVPRRTVGSVDRKLGQPFHDAFETLTGARCWQALQRVDAVAGESRNEIDVRAPRRALEPSKQRAINLRCRVEVLFVEPKQAGHLRRGPAHTGCPGKQPRGPPGSKTCDRPFEPTLGTMGRHGVIKRRRKVAIEDGEPGRATGQGEINAAGPGCVINCVVLQCFYCVGNLNRDADRLRSCRSRQ